MTILVIVLIIVLLIIILWKIFGEKNKLEHQINDLHEKDHSLSFYMNENAKGYQSNIPAGPSVEYVDLGPIMDSCGKDFTYSSKLLKDLYGTSISDKVLIYNKNDDLLYNNRWTSVRICKDDLNENDIIKYGINEARYRPSKSKSKS